MSAASLLAQLRAAGVSINSGQGRLIVEAPTGVITPELHAELVQCKAELICELEKPPVIADEDSAVIEARREIVGLLAVAYRRCSAVQRVGTDRSSRPTNQGLANSSETSVHGVVP